MANSASILLAEVTALELYKI